MKYIRTKDEKIIVNDFDEIKLLEDGTFMGFRFQKFLNYKKPKLVCHCTLKKEDIIKQVDNIEELCDEFICVENEFLHLIVDIIDFKREWQCAKITKRDTKFYGAIWTDKGLIYVAKMNEKGELELI